LECVSLYVSNSNTVSWAQNNLLIKDTHYSILKEIHNYQSDGYRRLNLTFLQPRNKLIPQYKHIEDDISRRTLYYNITFGCMAVFGNETVVGKFYLAVDHIGSYNIHCLFVKLP